MPQIYERLKFGASLNIWCILWCFFSCECKNLCHLAYSLSYHIVQKNGSHYYIFVVISTIFPPNFTKTSYPRREREREERSGDKMIMMEWLVLSFLDRKVTKVVTNSASIRRLACHSGITVDASLRLSLYKTKAQAKQVHRNYHSRRAQAAVKKSRVLCCCVPFCCAPACQYPAQAPLIIRQLSLSSASASFLQANFITPRSASHFSKEVYLSSDLSSDRVDCCVRSWHTVT
jgi:hypothetical protein